MQYHVVDTNILVVANGRDTHAAPQCHVAAARALREIRDDRSLVLDTDRVILGEYRRNVRMGAERGPGDDFFNWVTASGHRTVDLIPHPERGFQMFPSDPRLENFDSDDRIFVAAAIASGKTSTGIVNAVDRDYRDHREALQEAGVRVRELCPEEVIRPRRPS